MGRYFGIAAVITFAASAVFHVATFIPPAHAWVRFAWPLHLTVMVVCGAMIVSLIVQQRRTEAPATGFFDGLVAHHRAQKQFTSRVVRLVPRAAQILCVAFFAYAFINFALFMSLMDGSPGVKGGKYYLHSHGRKIRDLTREEYLQYQAYSIRGASGHWMAFSVIPAVYFLSVHSRLQRLDSSDRESSKNAQSPV